MARIFLLLALLFALPARAALFDRDSRDLAHEAAAANAAGKTLLVMFETVDCGYCAEMRRTVFGRPAVRELFEKHFHAVAVHGDIGTALVDPQGRAAVPAELAQRYGLRGTLGFAFFDREGKLLARHQGALTESDFLALGRYVAAGAYENESFAAWRRQRPDTQAAFNSGRVLDAPLLDFRFTDPRGRQRRLKELRGRVMLLAFGYTQCPDVCPTTLLEVREILRQLGPAAARIQPLFVSVDAARDTPSMLGAYAAAFDPRILAGVIQADQITHLARTAGLVAERQPGGAGHAIDHSAGFFILDARGRLRLRSDYGQDSAAVVADLRRLLAQDKSAVPPAPTFAHGHREIFR